MGGRAEDEPARFGPSLGPPLRDARFAPAGVNSLNKKRMGPSFCDPPLAPAAKVKSVRVAGPLPTAGPRRLFREATQLKTIGTAVRTVGIETPRAEPQIHPLDVAHRR